MTAQQPAKTKHRSILSFFGKAVAKTSRKPRLVPKRPSQQHLARSLFKSLGGKEDRSILSTERKKTFELFLKEMKGVLREQSQPGNFV